MKKMTFISLLMLVATLAMADGYQPPPVGSILVKSNFVQASQVIFVSAANTNILVALDNFTNYGTRYYWNPGWQYVSDSNPQVGAWTNVSGYFVASDDGVGFGLGTLAQFDGASQVGHNDALTNTVWAYPGNGGIMYLFTNGPVGVTSNQIIGNINLGQIDGSGNITTNNASTITSGTLGLPFLPAGVITNNESLNTTINASVNVTNAINGNTLTVTNLTTHKGVVSNLTSTVMVGPVTNMSTVRIPTNTAPFNRIGTTFLVTGARNTIDANMGHHFIHVWGQFTNTLAANVNVWLTNETFHSVSILGSPSTLMPAETNDFSLWIDASGGDTVTLTNQFTPGASLGVRIDGSTDTAW